jgi:FkbM family methyltransferase
LLEVHPEREKAFWTGVHEPHVQELLVRLAPAGGFAWDIGAHIGFFSVLLARAGARVLAVEPDPRTFPRLCRNVALNEAAIEPVNVAVAHEPGRAQLAIREESTSRVAFADWSGPTADVELTTLDELATRYGYPDLIKIDIEFSELQALRGGAATLARKPLIVCEVHGHKRETVPPFLEERGYRVDFATPTCIVACPAQPD